jgi:signal transduction histidine kinase/CheY-like chemotaxis protein
MNIFTSDMTLAFKDSSLEELFNKRPIFLYKNINTLSIIFTIVFSSLNIYDAFPAILKQSFTFVAVNYILICLSALLIYLKISELHSLIFYTGLIQLNALKALFGYVPSTYISLIECIPFFTASLSIGYKQITTIIIFKQILNLLVIICYSFCEISYYFNDALASILLFLVIYFYTKLSKQAFYYKSKLEKRRKIFESIFSNVNNGVIELKNNKAIYVNKHVLDVLSKIKSSYKMENENITEAVFSLFFDSKFEEGISKIDFKRLDNYRNDQFKLLGNRLLSISHIDLIEFEVWGRKIKSDNYLILLKECTNVNNLQEEITKQLKFKTSFLSKVAHELKNPLISISELVERLYNRPAKYSSTKTIETLNEPSAFLRLSKQRRNILEEIKAYLKYLMLLIKDLSYNVNDEFELSKCDLNLILSFIQTVTKCLIRKYNKESSLRFIINIDSNSVPRFVTTYEDGLKQILMNLITNAIKNTSSGSITLNITKQDDSNLKFQVDDTGMGFNIHNSSDFKQFSSNHQLGLYIIYDLTSKLGKTIEFTSEVNKGSSFWFTIPIEHLVIAILMKKSFISKFNQGDEIEKNIESISNDESSYNESLGSSSSFNSIYSKETVNLENLVITYYHDFNSKKTLVYNITDFINYTQAQNEQVFILIVDDEKITRLANIRLFSEAAEQEGKDLNILEAEDGIECFYYLFLCNKKGIKVSAIYSDQTMNYLDGSCILSILNTLIAKKAINSIPFYIITAYEDEATLVILRDTLPKEIYTKPLNRKVVEKLIKELYNYN